MRITVLLVSLLLVSQYASGVEVYEGEESVLLLCQLPVPAEEGVVVWGRDDLNPSIIHVRTEEERPPPPPIWPKVLPAVLVPVLVLAIGISVFMCLVYQRMKKTAVCQLKVVDVTEGAESVLLPFISKKLKNQETAKVEWKHIQEDEMKVVYEKDRKSQDVPDTGP
uniref:uncharacterized protein LOC112436507 isoform X2 n=1 Tax=Maylandia zebra TaxID=106582 RepID=UPI000D3104C1|nr:uncharacterized protein LOC112436507 isoform X2 [Maylandia zebra]